MTKKNTKDKVTVKATRATGKGVRKTVAKTRGTVGRVGSWFWTHRKQFVTGAAIFIVICHIPIPVPKKWAIASL